jgi:hypothetical protein
MTRVTRADAVWSVDDLEIELRRLPGVRAAGFQDFDDMLLVQLHVADRVDHGTWSDRPDRAPVPVAASRIAARHSDRPVAVEVVRWRTAPADTAQSVAATETVETESAVSPAVEVEAVEVEAVELEPATMIESSESVEFVESIEPRRTRLLAVLAFPDTDELEVHLVLDGKRTIGRAPVSRGLDGAVEATIDAVRELGTGIHPRLRWARAIDDVEIGRGDQEVVAVALDGFDSRSFLHYGLAAGSSLIDAAARATLDALNRHLSRDV